MKQEVIFTKWGRGGHKSPSARRSFPSVSPPPPKRIQIIGMGRLGMEMAYTFLLLKQNIHLLLTEPHQGNLRIAHAHFLDLLPIAGLTGNSMEAKFKPAFADCYVLAAGNPRRSISETKQGLFDDNLRIALNVIKGISKSKPLFVASNPPIEITKELRRRGYNAVELRTCTDKLRSTIGESNTINDYVLAHKGFTQWTPAFACAKQVLDYIGGPDCLTSHLRMRQGSKRWAQRSITTGRPNSILLTTQPTKV